MIKKVLFFTLSNIGDVILTLPILDFLKENFADSQITVMVGPRAKDVLEGNSAVTRLIVYDKYIRLREKVKLFKELRKERFDLVVDLRNSLFGAFLPARYRTSPFLRVPGHIRHMQGRNLYRLQMALKIKKPLSVKKGLSFSISPADTDYVDSLLARSGIGPYDKFILVSYGAGGDTRRWDNRKFTQLCGELSKDYKVILIGAKANEAAGWDIYRNCQGKILNFTGLTNLRQLAYLLKRAAVSITCDTGTLQFASYLDSPVVALFGPSDEQKYGPWSNRSIVVKKEISCRPCKNAHCKFGTIACMKLIKVEDVLRAVRDLLITDYELRVTSYEYKRILIARTDRVGDVLLSTPVIKALRDEFPCAYIAMIVSPYAKEIVEGNPYLDEVIIYDKDGKHKSWRRTVKFASRLKKKRFDLAVILHPTNRVHLIAFLAGIRRRLGYNRKLGFLLTDRLKHTKQLGEKHELEYNLDLLKHIGIRAEDKALFMPVNPEAEVWVKDLFKQQGLKEADKLLAIHPAASCPSKIWPNERFAEAADRLIEKYGFKVLVVAGPKDTLLAQSVIKNMRYPAIDLSGKTSVSQLASVIRRCRLFISNDSGPVHIASAVGTPVVSIFGRAQKGLSPKRWGPLGKKDKVLHKQVGCIECLAHNCTKEFACLKAVTVDDVLKAVDAVLTS